MRITPQKILVTAALGFLVGCAPATGGGDGGAPECELDTDCDGSDQCHPGLGICVQDCTADDADACPADLAPTCNGPDEDGNYPLELEDPNANQAYRLLCVCINDGDCGTGEICDPDTRECVEGEGGDEDAGPDNTCVDDSDCLENGELCTTEDTCLLADDLTSDCDAAADAPLQGGTDDIVIYNIETLAEPEAGGCMDANDNPLPLRSFFFEIYSEEDLTAHDAQDILTRPGFAAGVFFENADGAETSIDPVDGFDNEYTAIAYICGNPPEAAAQVVTDNNTSNAYCFDPQADPL